MYVSNLFRGLELEVSMSVIAKLDTKFPFKVGNTKNGDIYIMGEDSGVTGRAVKLKRGKLIIYTGHCNVSFGG